MIKLEDSVEIDVPISELYDWLLKLDEYFVAWSPYHTYFKKSSGGWEEGDEIQFGELVKGVAYDVKGIICRHQKGPDSFSITFDSHSGLAAITFRGRSTDSGCEFTHIEEFGKPDTFWGSIFNWLLFKVIARKKADFQLIKADMAEDNRYLKQILETGIYPAR
jgi:hypothetical protein